MSELRGIKTAPAGPGATLNCCSELVVCQQLILAKAKQTNLYLNINMASTTVSGACAALAHGMLVC